jgi:hypothetical protein
MVEVTAYGMDHIMAPIEAFDSKWMRVVFPEVPTGGLEAASGRVDLLIGHDNYRLFPEEHRRVQNAMLLRSRFGTGWIASGRPPGQGDPATSAEEATCTGAATSTEEASCTKEATSTEEATCTKEATSAEEATCTGAATSTKEATCTKEATSTEEATCTKEATSAEEATCTGAATGTEEVTSKEEAVNKEEPAHIATMDKPAKPPDRLDEQFPVTSAVFVQELKEPAELEEPEEPAEQEEQEELEEYRKLEQDLVLGCEAVRRRRLADVRSHGLVARLWCRGHRMNP